MGYFRDVFFCFFVLFIGEEEETTSVEQRPDKDQSRAVRSNSYLPDEGLHRDHVGGGPRARPDHCTSVGLTPAIIPNVDNSVV